MRTTLKLFVVVAFAAGTLAATAASAGAGVVVRQNTVTVIKDVVGPVPAGTTFTVELNCVAIEGGVERSAITEITFDDTGQPTSADTVNVGAGTSCTATETVNGGASSTTYACELATDPGDAECTADNVAEFFQVVGSGATITVTNTFTAAPPTTTTTTPPAPVAAAQAVQATPTFTG